MKTLDLPDPPPADSRIDPRGGLSESLEGWPFSCFYSQHDPWKCASQCHAAKKAVLPRQLSAKSLHKITQVFLRVLQRG